MKNKDIKLKAIKLIMLISVSFVAMHAASEREEDSDGAGSVKTRGYPILEKATGPYILTEEDKIMIEISGRRMVFADQAAAGAVGSWRPFGAWTGAERDEYHGRTRSIMLEISGRGMVFADQAGAGIERQNSTASSASAFPPHPMLAKDQASSSNVSLPYVFNINAFSGSEDDSHNGTTGQITRQNSTASSAADATARFIRVGGRPPFFDKIRSGAVSVTYMQYGSSPQVAREKMIERLIERKYTYAADSLLEEALDEKFRARKDDYADEEVNLFLENNALSGNKSAEEKLARNLARAIEERKGGDDYHEARYDLNAMARFLTLTESTDMIQSDSKRRKTQA